jgi:hypothetical protein
LDECCAAFSALAGLEALHLSQVAGLDRLLPHLAHAPALRTLTIHCEVHDLMTVASQGATHSCCDALQSLLAAAPRLEVRLEMAVPIDEWRSSCWYEQSSASQREEVERQWRELQRVGADLERVTIVNQ